MSEELENDPKLNLAMAVANGQSAAKWADANEVPRSTAYRWAKEPEFKAQVEEFRRSTLNQAIGIMSRHTTKAARGITQLADGAESESVKLRALRSILHDMMKISNFSNFASRLNKIEEQLRDRNARKSGAAQAI